MLLPDKLQNYYTASLSAALYIYYFYTVMSLCTIGIVLLTLNQLFSNRNLRLVDVYSDVIIYLYLLKKLLYNYQYVL